MSEIISLSAESGTEKARLQGRLTTPVVVLIILASLAPISAIVGPVALGFAFANGASMPATFLVATIVMLIFGVGYATISRRVRETGAFYAYVTKGLGRPIGGGAAYIALFAYFSTVLAVAILWGYYTHVLLERIGLNIPWWLLAMAVVTFTGIICRRNVEVGAKVQITILLVELLMVLIFNLSTLAEVGFSAFSLSIFEPGSLLSSGWSGFFIGLVLCFTMFIGMEYAAVYAEETRQPERSVSRATYSAIISIGVIYVTTLWCIVAANGTDNVQAVALADPGMLGIVTVDKILGTWGGVTVNVLIIISLMATIIGAHQAVSRYLLALARDGLMPQGLARIHAELGSPHVSSLSTTALTLAFLAIFALGSGHPFTVYFAGTVGLNVLGAMTLWVLTSLAIVVYYRRRNDPRPMATLILPLIATLCLSILVAAGIAHYDIISGSSSAIINSIPLLMIPIFLFGVWQMLNIKSNDPQAYALIWPDDNEDAAGT